MLKKILSLILVGVMALSIVACGGGSSSGNASNDGGSANANNQNIEYDESDFLPYFYAYEENGIVHITSKEIPDKTQMVMADNYVELPFDCEYVVVDDMVIINTAQSMFRNKKKLRTIKNVENIITKSMNSMFQDCENLTSIKAPNWNVKYVRDFGYMFERCFNLKTVDFSNWNLSTEKIGMRAMFSDCSALEKLNINKWKIPEESDLYVMFGNCHSLNSVGKTDVKIIDEFNRTKGQWLP